jgi:hypothetical protein
MSNWDNRGAHPLQVREAPMCRNGIDIAQSCLVIEFFLSEVAKRRRDRLGATMPGLARLSQRAKSPTLGSWPDAVLW